MRRLALLLLLAPAPALAQSSEIFGVPAGCEPQLSVLDADCYWTHKMACEGDPEGAVREVMPFQDGVFVALIDADGQWLENFDSYDGVTWTLGDNPSPMRLSELLATGTDSFDFTLRGSDGSLERYVGEDRLTGETAVIDGVTMQAMAFDYEVTDAAGAVLAHYRGTNHVTSEPPAYYGGPTEDLVAGTAWDATPIDILRPGEAGFLSAYAPEACLAALEARTPAEPAPEAKP